MTRIKVIQVSSTSSSFFLNSGKGKVEDIIKDDWFAQVAKEIKKIYPEVEVECWAPEKSYKKTKIEEYGGIKFRLFPTIISVRPGMELSFKMIQALKQEIAKSVKENKKLIIHIHEYHSWQTYLILLSAKKGEFKIVCQHHGGRSPLKNLKKYKRLLIVLPAIAIMQIMENLLFKKIDYFYALSDEEADYLKARTRGEIKFQTMGAGDEFFRKNNKTEAKKIISLKKSKKYLLYVGRLKTTKGTGELLDAMKKLEGENVELLLMGEGPDFKRFKRYAQENKVKNVRFLGAIYGEARLKYFDAADFLILPSYTEGAPVVIMEALAKNLPVVASDVGGISKMIKDGREGIIIPAKSSEEIVLAIKKIIHWPKKNVRKSSERFKWKNIIKATMQDYLAPAFKEN